MSELQTVITVLSGDFEAYGYAGLFGLLILTTILPLPLPEELMCITTGYLIERGVMAPVPAILTMFTGIVASDVYQYYFAQILGNKLMRVRPFSWILNEERIRKAEALFLRQGSKVLFFGRWVYGLRSNIHFAMGLLRFPIRRFIVIDAAVVSIQSVSLVLIGYYSPLYMNHWASHLMTLQRWLYPLSMIALSVALSGMIFKAWKKRQREVIL